MEAGDAIVLMKGFIQALLAIVVGLSSLLGGSAEAKTSLALLSSPLPVFAEQTDDFRFSGYTNELLRGIAREAGMDSTQEMMPFARMMATIEGQNNVMAGAVTRRPDRESRFYWITPVTANTLSVFVRKDSVHTSEGPFQLSSLASYSVMRKDYREDILRENGVTNVMPVNTWSQAIEAVIHGRTDAILFSDVGMALVCKNSELDCSSLKRVQVWDIVYSYIVIPRTENNLALAEKLTLAAARFKASDEYQALAEKTIATLQEWQTHVVIQDGVIRFDGTGSLTNTDNLWVIADLIPHFAELGVRGEVTGYAAQLVSDILTNAGIKKDILAAPWERIAREALLKSNVLGFSVARTPERESMFHWVTPIAQNMHGLYGVEKPKFPALSAVPSSSSIGVLWGDYRQQVAEKAGLKTVGFNSWENAVGALLNGGVDYVFGSQGAIEVGCERLGKPCDSITLAMNYRIITTYLVMSKKDTDPQLVERLRLAAVAVKRSPKYQAWSTTWSEEMHNRYHLTHYIEDGIVNLWTRQPAEK